MNVRCPGCLILVASVWLAPVARAQEDSGAPHIVGYVQARETYASATGLAATVNRARVGVAGAFVPGFTYRVTAELAGPTTPYTVSLRDAFVRWRREGLAITAGQFKTPFSRAFLTGLPALETADYAAVVSALAPKWDIGVMAGYEWGGVATATLGVFNGEGMNVGVNRDSSVMVAARVTVQPWSALTLAADVARYRDSTRYGLEGGIALGCAQLRGEYIRQHRLAVAADDVGWYLVATCWLTPRLQVVAQQEDFRRPSLPAVARNLATILGANLYVAGGRVRLLANYVSRRVGTRSGTLIVQAQIRFGRGAPE